ncbi:MAG TPA: four helix bundle protein [Cyclobacteriaceae bacterium]|nr:four helix bundle protein [Cyclobacteriaceae bacterium]
MEVWKESVELTGLVHEVCKTFPKDEIYILTSQIKRAADSVSLNLAEGSTGQSNAEFKRFLGFSIRSGIEVIGCLYIAKRRGLISDADFNIIYGATDNLVMRIQALRKSITKN